MPKAKSPLVYLKENLDPNFFSEWKTLSDVDKAWYKAAATVEMQAQGIVVLATE